MYMCTMIVDLSPSSSCSTHAQLPASSTTSTAAAGQGSSTQLQDTPQKEALVEQLVAFLDTSIVQWCEEADLLSLCSSNHKQLLELKVNK